MPARPRSSGRGGVFALAVLSAAGCDHRTPAPVEVGPPSREAAAPEPVPEAAPRELAGPAEVVTPAGVIAVPVGAHGPRPIMIALHGGSDHPEWACNAWRGITSGFPFIVCPRGVGAESALAWSSPADTKARIERALAATRAQFGDWTRPTDTFVLVGFSMGATQTAYLARSAPTRYRRIVLAESAYAPEPAMAFAPPWATGGGERVIFLCTTPGCEGPYRNAARNVAAQHVTARLNIAGTAAHGMWDTVVRSMRRDWPWLVAGAEGWDDYAPPDEELPGHTESFEAK